MTRAQQRRRPAGRRWGGPVGHTAAPIVAAAVAVVAAAGLAAGRPTAASAAALAPLAACDRAGWQRIALPPAIAAQSLAVDAAVERRRLYAAMYRVDGAVGPNDHAVWAIGLDALGFAPLTGFDAATKAVRAIAVRPDSGALAAGLAAGGVVHAAADGTLGAIGLDRRLTTAVEAAPATTFAGATDLVTDAAAGLEAGHAAVWRQQADGAWLPLAAAADPFGSGYFWDLTIDGTGRLWAAKDGDGLWTLAGAATDTPGAWTPASDIELRNRTVQAIEVDPVDPSLVYAGLRSSVTKPGTDVAGRYGLRLSRDGGASWTGYRPPAVTQDEIRATYGVTYTPFRDWAVPSVAVGPAGGWVFASVWGLGLFASRDAGDHWHRLSLPAAGIDPSVRIAPYLDAVATARVDGACDLVFATGKAGLFVRSVADVAAEMARAIYLPTTIGAPWDILGRRTAADATPGRR